MRRGLRFDALARIEPGQTEWLPDSRELQLITVALTDDGPLADRDGNEYTQPDVVCHLRPDQARGLANKLLSLAERAGGGPR